MIEDGDTVLEPSKADDIAADAAKRGAILILVSVEPPHATVHVNITARESQMASLGRSGRPDSLRLRGRRGRRRAY
ncbi:MAG: hypothetical protein WB762_08210 [Candidatus Sulfotelmatobacter sp.]